MLPLGLSTALSLMGDATLYTVLPTHTADAGITLAGVGVILGVNRAVRLFLNGPAGLAYDRWPRRRLFVSALFVGALSTAIYGATQSFWPLFAARLLWGLAWSGIWVGGATMILDVATDRERGRWTGFYQTWFFLGGAAGALGGGLLTDRLGYAWTMWIGATLTAIGGLVALFLLPETRGIRKAIQDSITDQHPSPPSPFSASTNSLSLRANAPLWFAALLQGINRFAVSGVMSATMGLLVRDHLPIGGTILGVASLTGILMAGRTVLSMLSAPLAGILSDRAGSRWAVLLCALAIGMAGMALVAWSVPMSILAGVLAVAVSRGSVQSLVTSLTGDLASQGQRGRAIGILHTAGDFGSAIGPSLAYALLPWVGLRGVYLLCTMLFAVSMVVTFRFSRRQKVRGSAP